VLCFASGALHDILPSKKKVLQTWRKCVVKFREYYAPVEILSFFRMARLRIA